jgi:hypothetical protein
MEYIYRSMAEENGMPKLGSSATTLGVRPGIDIDVDEAGMVHRPDFKNQMKNGTSASPSVAALPDFALPPEFGGANRKTRIWRIRTHDLGPHLVAEQDGSSHISIGPARTTGFSDYVKAIQDTAPDWELVTPDMDQNDDLQRDVSEET